MKEATQIITCEITHIIKNPRKTPDLPFSEEQQRLFAESIKRDLHADDVVVTNIKAFVREA